MSAETASPKIDGYIAKAQPFARPVLLHLRELLHRACPTIEESIKWGQPFFVYRGAILCHMGAFKAHCTFSFWGKEISAVLCEARVLSEEKSSSFGRITGLGDLPSDKQLLAWIRQAAAFVDSGQYTSPMAERPKKAHAKAIEAPVEFKSALKAHSKASAVFEAFNPSCKREYIEWIAEAKRPETQANRIATAIEWIAEGKQRNWKYQNR